MLRLLSLLLVSLLVVQCGGGGGGSSTTVAAVAVAPAGVTLGVGQSATLTAAAINAEGVAVAGKTYTFSSSNTTVASVGGVGNTATVTALAVGSAVISASSDGKTGTASVTVNAVGDIQVTGQVVGVDGETRAGLAGATVDLQDSFGVPSGSTVTTADGSFSFAVRTDGSGVTFIDVTARKTGYVTTRLARAQVRPGGTQIEPIVLVRETSVPGAISGRVLNALDNQGVGGAVVQLFSGQGLAPSSTPLTSRTSDAQGGFSFTALAAGTYTVLGEAAGFRANFRTAITVATGAVVAQDVVLSPEGTGVVRIVLTWGDAPRDVDAHLTGPNPSDGNRFHVYFVNRLDSSITPFAGLDVDDRDGGGPETITISRFNAGGFYRYSVHDFTNRNNAGSTELGRSGAKVELYTSRDTRTFFVPNQSGNLWTVFELSGDIAEPTITTRNEMSAAADPATIP